MNGRVFLSLYEGEMVNSLMIWQSFMCFISIEFFQANQQTD